MSDEVKKRTADLYALVAQFERNELTIVEIILKAYSMGHDDVTAAWNRANEILSKALHVALPEVKKP